MTLIAAGGDLRQKAAAEALSGEYDVYVTGFGKAADTVLPDAAEVLLLPTPAAPDGRYLFTPFAEQPLALDELLGRLSPGAVVLGGRMTAELCDKIKAAGFSAIDYTQSDSFAERNAIPTAEGAIMLAMQALPVTLHGLSCLILGAGRISRALQTRLLGLGAHVTVAARRFPDLARTKGCKGNPEPGARAGIFLRVHFRGASQFCLTHGAKAPSYRFIRPMFHAISSRNRSDGTPPPSSLQESQHRNSSSLLTHKKDRPKFGAVF